MLNEDELLAGSPHGGSLALCVRQCDGGFFPVSYAAQRHNLDELQDLCKALCPMWTSNSTPAKQPAK